MTRPRSPIRNLVLQADPEDGVVSCVVPAQAQQRPASRRRRPGRRPACACMHAARVRAACTPSPASSRLAPPFHACGWAGQQNWLASQRGVQATAEAGEALGRAGGWPPPKLYGGGVAPAAAHLPPWGAAAQPLGRGRWRRPAPRPLIARLAVTNNARHARRPRSTHPLQARPTTRPPEIKQGQQRVGRRLYTKWMQCHTHPLSWCPATSVRGPAHFPRPAPLVCQKPVRVLQCLMGR
jgi:hypothetical protein